MKYLINSRGFLCAYTLLLFVLFPLTTHAQNISGRIIGQESLPISYASITLLHIQDSTMIAQDMSDEEGQFTIPCDSDSVLVKVSCLGYETAFRILYRDKQNQVIQLAQDKLTLDEVVVEGKSRYSVMRTATGEIYRLSKYAKNSGDPFRALTEIPVLNVNVALQSVKMADGSSPLVLIDGRSINSGIAPVNPKEIESVEVMDVVSARYLKNGVSHILNIRLKKKQKPFQWIQLATRHDIPFRYSMGVGYFEVGNPKFSLFGRMSADITHKKTGDFESRQTNVGYNKQTEGDLQDNQHSGLGELLFKWTPDERNFFAAHAYGSWEKKKSEAWGAGTLITDKSHEVKHYSFSEDKSYTLTTSLYFQHDFSKARTLEATLAYNVNNNKDNGHSEETYTDEIAPVSMLYDFHNKRSSGSLDVNYSASWNNINSINIGNETKFLCDHIDKVSEKLSVFRHRSWDEYLYASFSSKWRELSYMLSAGLNAVWLKAGDASNHYVRPRISASGTYEWNGMHSTNIRYGMSALSPSVGQLNPYDISTDPMVVSKGNPYLTPQLNQYIALLHTYHYKDLYLTGFTSYGITTDIIEAYGYTEQGRFVNTYQNSGRYNALSVGVRANVNFPKRLGRAYLNITQNWSYFTGQPAKPGFGISGGLWFYYKKWTVGSDVEFFNYDYTPISRTRQLTPGYSMVQVIYNFTNNLYISIALPYVFGSPRTETETYADSYTSYYLRDMSMTNMTQRPWILLRYTIRKNDKRKIKLGNIVSSKENGISLEHK